jgi:hypothetical protein
VGVRTQLQLAVVVAELDLQMPMEEVAETQFLVVLLQ